MVDFNPWSDWNLEMLVFVKGGKPENPMKNPRSKARTNNKLNPHMAPGRNRTRATLVGGERSHHCTILAPLGSVIVRTNKIFISLAD